MFRLVRKPSLWVNLLGRLLFAMLCAAAAFAAWWWMHRSAVIMSLAVAIALLALWDVIRFAWRAHFDAPVVEIDCRCLAYGDSAQLHVIEAHAESLAELGVKLIGECSMSAATDISSFREMKTARTRCYEQELLRMKHDDAAPINRVVRMQLPKSPPADAVSWTIVIDSRLRHGDVVEHPYPLRVRESA